MRRTLLLTAVLLSPFLVAIALVVGPAPNLAVLTRDMAATAGLEPWVGYLSFVGVLYWTAASAICLFGASMTGRRDDRVFLCWFGGLLALLAIDDLFMLHEVVIPGAGVPEAVVKLGYLVLIGQFAVRFRGRFIGANRLVGAAALLGLGMSFVIDYFSHGGNTSSAIEDTLKFAGIVLALVAAVQATRSLVGPATGSRERPPSDDAGRGALPPGRDSATA